MKETKICTKCKIEKSLSEFYKDKQKKDGLTSICKICHKKYYKDNFNSISDYKKLYHTKNLLKINNHNKNYYKEYPWKKVFASIKYRCNNSNCKQHKNYGGRGIKCLITADELKKLWFRDKAYLMKKPSIDRINNDGHYEYDNCRFIEHTQNILKSNQIRKRRILQFDLDNKFIREWESLLEVSNNLNIDIRNISNCAKKNQKFSDKRYTAYKFIWRYDNA